MSQALNILLPLSVLLVMVAVGFELTMEDLRKTLAQRRAAALGLGAQILITPLAGLAIGQLLDLRPELAVGLVVLASCPGGTGSNVLTYIVRADVALSIGISAISSVVTLFTIPLIIQTATTHFLGTAGVVQLPVVNAIGQLLLLCFVPLSIGAAVRWRWPATAERLVRPVSRAGTALLLGASVFLFYGFWAEISADLASTIPACTLLFLFTVGLGGGGAKLLGLENRTAVTLALEVGFQNVALASLITVTLLKQPELNVVGATYGLLALGVLLPWALWRRGAGKVLPAAPARA